MNFQTPFSVNVAGVLAECRTLLLSNRKRATTLIFVVPCIMLNSEIIPTRCNNCVFILRNGFTLHVSGDNSTHHQEYNAVYDKITT